MQHIRAAAQDLSIDAPQTPCTTGMLGCGMPRPIPIGPHWMLIWPFDAESSGLSTVMRDAGTMIMFAGTPYAHLHICEDPWAGNEYHPGDRAVWTMTYRQ